MKMNPRLIGTALLVALLLGFLFLSLNLLGWKGPFFLFSGALLAWGWAWLFFPQDSPPAVAAVPPAPPGPEALPVEGDRAVYIPGRNFEEMLKRLGSNESMLNLILNSMGEGVLLLNQADRIVLMNPVAEKILATSEKENIGRHYLETVRNPVLADLLEKSKRENLSSGEIDIIVGREEKSFALSAAAMRVERDQLLGQIVVLSDITPLKRLMRMRTEFVANVSHELKTPLTAVLGYVETLLSGAIDDKKNRVQFLQKISDQAQRLNALITDVLELSRIESGVYVSSLEPVELSEVAQQAVELLKAKWEAKEIKLRQEINEGVKVTAHREGLFHVLENLLDNAVKYSPPKSEILLSSRAREDGKVEVVVSDHGRGIPKDVQTRVFERFFRVDVSRSREAGGTGLGLAIVKHLVEKMNGEVSLQSEEGKGSAFTVVLAGAA